MVEKFSNMSHSFILTLNIRGKRDKAYSRGQRTSYGGKKQSLSTKGLNREAKNPTTKVMAIIRQKFNKPNNKGSRYCYVEVHFYLIHCRSIKEECESSHANVDRRVFGNLHEKGE